MEENTRRAHLNKLHRMPPKVIDQPTNQPECSSSVAPITSLSIDVNAVSANSTVQLSVYQGIWEKASPLVNQEGAIAPAPGYPPEA